jgi:hypothetical protein
MSSGGDVLLIDVAATLIESHEAQRCALDWTPQSLNQAFPHVFTVSTFSRNRPLDIAQAGEEVGRCGRAADDGALAFRRRTRCVVARQLIISAPDQRRSVACVIDCAWLRRALSIASSARRDFTPINSVPLRLTLVSATARLSRRMGTSPCNTTVVSSARDLPPAGPTRHLFVLYDGGPYPRAVRSRWAPKGVFRALSSHLRHPRNARSSMYMENLARAVCPAFSELDVVRVPEHQRLPEIDWPAVSEVILLWPDSNGLGWSPIERRIFRCIPSSARVSVLNGRRRHFALTRTEWRRMIARRFLEKSLLAEWAFTLGFIAFTPILVIWDLAHGRR